MVISEIQNCNLSARFKRFPNETRAFSFCSLNHALSADSLPFWSPFPQDVPQEQEWYRNWESVCRCENGTHLPFAESHGSAVTHAFC